MTRHRLVGLALSSLGIALTVAAAAQPMAPTAPAATTATPPLPQVQDIPFQKFTLKNGLEVIFHEDRSLPLVAVNVWYHVGPANEPPRRSGFAHLFEHLMFEGSRHAGREFDTLLESAGATNSNGTTSWDRTNYFETVPREHLELVLWLESDRMGFMLDALTLERLEVQRGVVKNERRQTYENSPYGPSSLALYDALFPPGHPYHGAVIGSMQDLGAATMKDVEEFFRAFYAPSNATLTLAGDFDAGQARAAIERYFGTLPDRPKPTAVAAKPLPPPQPREIVVKEPVQLARVNMAWLTPPAFTPDDATLDVTMAVLAGGKATRLYKALVVEQKLASEVQAQVDSNQVTSIAEVSATAASGKSQAELKKAIGVVLDRLGKEGPTAAELDRAKRRLLLNLQSQLLLLNGPGGESGRAGMLQRFNHYLKDPGYLRRWVEMYSAVSPNDVKRVVAQYLKPQNAVSVITQPAPEMATQEKP
jgi:zinc protease